MWVLGQRHYQNAIGIACRDALGVNFIVELKLPLERLHAVLLPTPTRSRRVFVVLASAGDGQYAGLYFDLKIGTVAPRCGKPYFVAVFQLFNIDGWPESLACIALRPMAAMMSHSFGGISAASVHSMMMIVTHDSIGFGGAG